MLGENLHPTDQELLLAADGELSSSRGAEVHAHLSSCWHCRARMAEVEKTVFDFVRGTSRVSRSSDSRYFRPSCVAACPTGRTRFFAYRPHNSIFLTFLSRVVLPRTFTLGYSRPRHSCSWPPANRCSMRIPRLPPVWRRLHSTAELSPTANSRLARCVRCPSAMSAPCPTKKWK